MQRSSRLQIYNWTSPSIRGRCLWDVLLSAYWNVSKKCHIHYVNICVFLPNWRFVYRSSTQTFWVGGASVCGIFVNFAPVKYTHHKETQIKRIELNEIITTGTRETEKKRERENKRNKYCVTGNSEIRITAYIKKTSTFSYFNSSWKRVEAAARDVQWLSMRQEYVNTKTEYGFVEQTTIITNQKFKNG